jgi:transketolase
LLGLLCWAAVHFFKEGADLNTIELEKIAKKIRIDTIKMIYKVKSGHPGGALSITDILAVLYFDEMHVDAKNPQLPDRDRFVLSKGHAATSLYAALAAKGYFAREELWTLRQYQSILQGHPDMKVTPGLDMSSGSLGQGLSIANGMALAAKLQKKEFRVYAILGDGELDEGQIWEAAMTAPQFRLDNIVAIIDKNGFQINGTTDEVMKVASIEDKFQAFGWNVLSIDGNDISAIKGAFQKAKNCKDKPTAIVAKTLKGKGVSYMEDRCEWHSGVPTEEQYQLAMQELGGNE